jgi:hypothetical protein
MGVFADDAERRAYQSQWCATCGHQTVEGCPVWTAHGLGEGAQDVAPLIADMLQLLIPFVPDEGNAQCTMHVDTKS